jgi:ankyrin repeat protein
MIDSGDWVRLEQGIANVSGRTVLQLIDGIDKTILHYACEKGNPTLVEGILIRLSEVPLIEATAFMDKGFEFQGRMKYAVEIAAERGYVEIVRMLMEYGAAVHLPIRGGNGEIIRIIHAKMPEIILDLFDKNLKKLPTTNEKNEKNEKDEKNKVSNKKMFKTIHY